LKDTRNAHRTVDTTIILYWMLKKLGREDVDWIHLAQDREQWLAAVNTVMNLRVPHKTANFLTS